MKTACAYYVSEPDPKIFIFVDEPASGLPEGAALIVEATDEATLLDGVAPYFILGRKINGG